MAFHRKQGVKEALLIGDNISNPYVGVHLRKVIRKIATDYPEVVFCGSLGLVINGKLNRSVKDIDIITQFKQN